MAHRTGGRAQTTGLGGARTFEGGIYARYSAGVLARDAVQPVDLPGFFALSGHKFPCHPQTPPPGSYTNSAVRRSLTLSAFAASPTFSKPCPPAAWVWSSRPL